MTPPGMVASDRTCEEVERALCRSVLWEALAIGFRPPEMATIGRLHAGTGLIAAAEVVAGPELAASVRTLVERDAEPTTLDQAYQRLFGHVAHGETPLFETEYGTDQSFLQPHALADVGGFYAAFGLDLARGPAMRPDHAACECEFMMFLARKEAWALEAGDTTMAETTRAATRLFLRDHVGRFLPALGARLVRADGDGFYGRLGTLSHAVVTAESERLGVRAGPESLHLRTISDDGVVAACGSCTLAPGADGTDDGP